MPLGPSVTSSGPGNSHLYRGPLLADQAALEYGEVKSVELGGQRPGSDS